MRSSAKPFLKWAGGKGQLLGQMSERFPEELLGGNVHTYIEPFLGGGAPFFHIAQLYPIERFFISDINADLILVYKTIRQEVGELIQTLEAIQTHYYSLEPHEQEAYYYDTRKRFNEGRRYTDFSSFSKSWLERSSQTIFLNKTCFNGLFRFNRKDEFNTSFGSYKNPLICDTPNLLAAAEVLRKVAIERGDFSCCSSLVDAGTFVYFDPPYRPLSKTANFTSYSSYTFNDQNQYRLSLFYRYLHTKGAKLMLSNSDAANGDGGTVLETLYRDFRVERVRARRAINRDASKRGKISELLIMNY